MIEVPNYAEILKARGLSLGEFAKSVGLSKTYVAEILGGKRQAPPETEERILAGFDQCYWCKQGWPHPRPKVVKIQRSNANPR